jgi:uncharacterized protein (DUF4213/DUF364 family)
MGLVDDLLADLPDGRVEHVTIGLHWTAVTVDTGGRRQCGLASTIPETGHTHGEYDVADAGKLTQYTGRSLASLALSKSAPQRSIGFAAINALLPRQPETWFEANGAEIIAHHGAGKTVTLVGHFPFTEQLKSQVGTLHVLEQNPLPGDLPADAAPQVLPASDVVALTSMTLLNDTFAGLAALCRPDAKVLALGPTTPLSPVLFDYGVSIASGAVVQQIDAVLRHVQQGANFRQVRRAGVRLVNISPTV